MLSYRLITEEEKTIISDWKYPGEYAIYNLPPYEEQKQRGIMLANPERKKNYYSYCEGGRLIGFTNILEKESEVCIGIGVSPDLCGNGWGQKILECASAISGSLYPAKRLCLEVRTWNERAIKCYLKAGFRIDGEAFVQKTNIGEGLFYRMVKE